MSVASKNPFALLNDNEDESRAKAPAAAAPVEQPKPNANRKPTATRGGRYYQRGGPRPAVSSPPAEGDAAAAPGDKKREYRGDRGDRAPRGDRGERGERGERGRGRGGRGRGRGGDRDPRPDRHSATGITDSQKKVHQGWGGDRGDTEYKDETNGANDATAGDAWGAPTSTEAWDAPAKTGGDAWDAAAGAEGADPWADPAGGEAGGDAKGEGKPAADDEGRKRRKFEDEEDEGKMTLDEYRAKNATSEVPKLEIRKIDEGSSDLFKGARQLTKDTEGDAYFVGKQAKSPTAPKARKEGKQFIEIDARFEPPSRGGRGRGGGRGGRGDFRGGRGGDGGHRGGGRHHHHQQQPQGVDVADTNAFPSL